MKSDSKAQKKLPHRTSSANRKAYRQRVWARQMARKAIRQEAQNSAAKRNKRLRESGEMTPWETAKAARRARRSS